MNTYYIIDENNKLVHEFDAEKPDAAGTFESWLNDFGELKEFLLVQKITFGKLQVAITATYRQ